jgi:formylmethanofuran dehydrogenase subunit D
MQTIIDAQGRIALEPALLGQLGVAPGDAILVEPRGGEIVLRPVSPRAGLARVGDVLVHVGVSDWAQDEADAVREGRLDALGSAS